MAAAPIRIAFILHVMQVAGAEVLVAETIRRLGPRIDPLVLCLDDVGQLGLQMQAEGVPVIAYGRRSGWDLGLPRRMARDLRSHGIDLVQAHQYTPFFYAALAARLCKPRPHVIFTEHGRHYPDVVNARRRWFNRLVLARLADKVTAVCDFSARSLKEKDGFNNVEIEVIQNGIDSIQYQGTGDRRELRTQLGLNPGRRYLACIARFHAVKDHRTLVTAFARVSAQREDVDLLLVGDGALREELQAQVESLRLSERVHFLGVRRDVAMILRAVDLVVMTSVSEAASITLLEAMAAERPVIVTAVGGNPEIVRDRIDGFLVPRADPEATAAAILRVLGDDGLAHALGTAGASRVREHFQLDRTIERYGAIFEAAAERRRRCVEAGA